MNDEKKVTLSGRPAAEGYDGGAPQPIDPKTGMHGDYWVLSAEERAKGFVRPVRTTYKHVGVRPKYPVRDLTAEEQERYGDLGYVKYEEYPPGSPEAVGSLVGRYWTAQQLSSGCGGVTSMNRTIAETYARDPKFYGATFCVNCRAHLPVGEQGEFIWVDDGTRVGS